MQESSTVSNVVNSNSAGSNCSQKTPTTLSQQLTLAGACANCGAHQLTQVPPNQAASAAAAASSSSGNFSPSAMIDQQLAGIMKPCLATTSGRSGAAQSRLALAAGENSNIVSSSDDKTCGQRDDEIPTMASILVNNTIKTNNTQNLQLHHQSGSINNK